MTRRVKKAELIKGMEMKFMFLKLLWGDANDVIQTCTKIIFAPRLDQLWEMGCRECCCATQLPTSTTIYLVLEKESLVDQDLSRKSYITLKEGLY